MKRPDKYQLSVLAFLATATVLSDQVRPQEKTKSEIAFRQLASLVGEWEGGQDGVPTPIKETYTLIADGSALMAHTKAADEPAMHDVHCGRRSPDRDSLL